MEERPEKKSHELSADEKMFLVAKAVRTKALERLTDRKNTVVGEVFELSHLIGESYQEFLPRLNKDYLKSDYEEFARVIKTADQKLAVCISKLFKTFVTGSYVLSSDQISTWKFIILKINEEVLPRMKEENLYQSIKILEGAIIQAEIKIASDDASK